jgi:hypothetical protein
MRGDGGLGRTGCPDGRPDLGPFDPSLQVAAQVPVPPPAQAQAGTADGGFTPKPPEYLPK